MLEALTGLGLATSAGLNAYIPLLVVGLIGRYTELMTLPPSWQWLSNGGVIAILAVLLAIEFVADKVPLVDHANDVIQTVIRPSAGGIAFGAASGAQTVTVPDPGRFFGNHHWLPVAIGVLVSLTVHGAKATARPVVNTTTAGFGAPIISTIEDVGSVALSLIAILSPVLVAVIVVAMIAGFWALISRRRRRRDGRRFARTARTERS